MTTYLRSFTDKNEKGFPENWMWYFRPICPKDAWLKWTRDSCAIWIYGWCPAKKGPTRHAYAWKIGPFWQDTLDIRHSASKGWQAERWLGRWPVKTYCWITAHSHIDLVIATKWYDSRAVVALSWYVHKYVVIGWPATKQQQEEVSIECELRAKKTLVKPTQAVSAIPCFSNNHDTNVFLANLLWCLLAPRLKYSTTQFKQPILADGLESLVGKITTKTDAIWQTLRPNVLIANNLHATNIIIGTKSKGVGFFIWFPIIIVALLWPVYFLVLLFCYS